MAAVLPTQAGQAQAVSAETRTLVENLFQGTTEAAYRQLWAGCQANPTLAHDVQVARAQQDDTARTRAVYTRVIKRVIKLARRTDAALRIESLQPLDAESLVRLVRAETLYKFFFAYARSPASHLSVGRDVRFDAWRFLVTLLTDIFGRDILTCADAIARWMDENRDGLAQVENLTFTDSRFTSLPPQIGLFTGLRELCLNDNQLRSLPSEIGQCTALQSLELDHNQLISIPSELSRCISLRRLRLGENQLTTIPATLRQWTQLRYLDIRENQIVQSREDILQLLRPGFPDHELHFDDQRPPAAHAAQVNPPAQPQGFWECIWQGIVSAVAQVSEWLSHAWQSLVACLGRLIRSAN